jgi:hypothetical protein
MEERRRRPWVLLFIAAGLMLAALILLYVTAPPSTSLTVQVVDADTGEPLAGALVQAQAPGEQPLPTAATDDTGLAFYEDVPPSPTYLLRIQKVNYDLTFEPDVAVPVGEDTEFRVPLHPRPGERLFVGLDGAKVAQIDTASLLTVRTIRLPGWKQDPVSHLHLHPDKDLLYTVTGEAGCILDSRTGAVRGQFEVPDSVENVGLRGDGQHLLAVSKQADGSARLWTWDVHTGELLTSTQTVDPTSATQFVWMPADGVTYVVEPSRHLLWVLDVEALQVLDRISTDPYPREGLLSADGRSLRTWSSEYFEEVQLAFGTELNPIPNHQSLPANSSAWTLSPNGRELYVLDARLGTLSILDLSGQDPPTLVAVGKDPEALAVSKDGVWAYVANQESQTVSVVYLPAPRVLHTIPVLGEPLSLALREGTVQE